MKRLFILGFSAALLAGGISSCKKTNKGKMANDWTISSMTSESNNTGSNGFTSTYKTTIDAEKGTKTSSSTSSGVTTIGTPESGAIKELSMKIEKDGTWSKVSNITWTKTTTATASSWNAEITVTTVNVTTEDSQTSGTWNFVNKNKTGEFKKNERVLFNTLKEDYNESGTITTTTETDYTDNTPDETETEVSTITPSSSNSTYSEGSYYDLYTVVESKRKELKLSSGFEDESSNQNGSSSYKSENTMTLIQK